MHILVTGSNGQLGSEIRKISSNFPNYRFSFTDIEDLDITNKYDVDNYINSDFDVIINCAAYTAVDKCETERSLARKVNVIAVRNLAMACAKNNISLVHISTDYVYDGKNHTPYKETDFTHPESYYGQSKLEGEQVIDEFAIKAVIIRTSWLYSSFGNNFVKTIIKHAKTKDELRVVFDQIGTPTYAGDLAELILNNIHNIEEVNEVKLYNYSNEGVCSWYDFAKEIVDLMNIECLISPIETKDYPLPAPRPAYSILNKEKIKAQLKTSIPYWKDSLKKCLKEL